MRRLQFFPSLVFGVKKKEKYLKFEGVFLIKHLVCIFVVVFFFLTFEELFKMLVLIKTEKQMLFFFAIIIIIYFLYGSQ